MHTYIPQVACLGCALLLVPLPVLAQERSAPSIATVDGERDVLDLSASRLRLMTESQARLAQLEDDYARVDLMPPRAGIGVSSALLAMGFVAVLFSVTYVAFSDPGELGAPIAATVGSATFLIGGVTGVGVSSVRLRRKKAERARLEREIAEIKRSMDAPGAGTD